MNNELKRRALEEGKIIKQNIEDFCFGTIVLTTTIYEVPTYSYKERFWHDNARVVSGIQAIYAIEVTIDGNVVAERWGTSSERMNEQYLILKFHCEG